MAVEATYFIKTTANIQKAADALAIGQSLGNPNVRALGWETKELKAKHLATWQQFGGDDKEGHVIVTFPDENISPHDGWAFLLSVLMGGQTDIDIITECRLTDLVLPESWHVGPRYGVAGIREKTGVYGRPLIGGIIKPKLGLTPEQLADMCKILADAGFSFAKDDEILSDPSYCPLEKRVSAVARAIEGYKMLYFPCITGRNPAKAAKVAYDCGAGGVHLNWWSGLDAFAKIREQCSLPLFFQTSGNKVVSQGPFSISFNVLLYMARIVGMDWAHIGMVGGYLDDGEDVARSRVRILQGHLGELKPMVPSLSCGLHPGLCQYIRSVLGNDILLNSGGSVHGHPLGTSGGAKAMMQAVTGEHREEYQQAIDLWGYRSPT